MAALSAMQLAPAHAVVTDIVCLLGFTPCLFCTECKLCLAQLKRAAWMHARCSSDTVHQRVQDSTDDPAALSNGSSQDVAALSATSPAANEVHELLHQTHALYHVASHSLAPLSLSQQLRLADIGRKLV